MKLSNFANMMFFDQLVYRFILCCSHVKGVRKERKVVCCLFCLKFIVLSHGYLIL